MSARRVILVLGQPTLENTVLAREIGQQTGYGCYRLARYEVGSSRPDHETLALIEAFDHETPDLLSPYLVLLAEYGIRQAALYSVSPDGNVDGLLSCGLLRGLFYAGAPHGQMVKGIEAIFSGELWFPRRLLAAHLARTRSRSPQLGALPCPLTQREIETLRLVANGESNARIAGRLNVSHHTVTTHLYNLFKKLEVTNRIQAVNWAKEHMADLTR